MFERITVSPLGKVAYRLNEPFDALLRDVQSRSEPRARYGAVSFTETLAGGDVGLTKEGGPTASAVRAGVGEGGPRPFAR